MTKEQIISVCKEYDEFLEKEGFLCREESDTWNSYSHIRWMLSQIPTFVNEGKLEKSFRWLGFVQGFLWTNGDFTISEMKNHNR